MEVGLKYNYFVSFVRERDGKKLFSNNGVSLDKKIDSFEDILKIEEILNRRLSGTNRILNFQLLGTSEEDEPEDL